MIIKQLTFIYILLIAIVFADDEIAKDIKVDETYLQVADYVAQSPKYGAFARAPGPYDDAKKNAQDYIDRMQNIASFYDPLVNDGAKEGYRGKGIHEEVGVDADYVIDNPEDFRTAFNHLGVSCLNSKLFYNEYTIPNEFRFDLVNIKGTDKAYKVYCSDVNPIHFFTILTPSCSDFEMATLFNKSFNRCKVYLESKKKTYTLTLNTNSYKLKDKNPPQQKTLVEFIMQNNEWKTKLNVKDKSGAYDWVENIFNGKKVYDDIMHEYEYWHKTEKIIAVEAEERHNVFNPKLTGNIDKQVDYFLALTKESAVGHLSTKMEIALKTGNTVVGEFKTFEPVAQWEYTITATDGSVDGDSPTDFMKKLQEPGVEGKITDKYIIRSAVTGLLYNGKKGTCNVKLTSVKITIPGRPRDSPQYNDKEGKEMMPVSYDPGHA